MVPKIRSDLIFVILMIGLLILPKLSLISYASSIVELTLKEMCNQSSHIIISRVNSVESYHVKEQNRIFTDIELSVNEVLKGDLKENQKVKLTVYGGTVGEITTFVVGAPNFRIGENSLLFLSETQSDKFGKVLAVLGLSQGKFNIIVNPETGEEEVFRDQVQIALRLEKTGQYLDLTNQTPLKLREFLEKINQFN